MGSVHIPQTEQSDSLWQLHFDVSLIGKNSVLNHKRYRETSLYPSLSAVSFDLSVMHQFVIQTNKWPAHSNKKKRSSFHFYVTMLCFKYGFICPHFVT